MGPKADIEGETETNSSPPRDQIPIVEHTANQFTDQVLSVYVVTVLAQIYCMLEQSNHTFALTNSGQKRKAFKLRQTIIEMHHI
jgi:hypothetical protein